MRVTNNMVTQSLLSQLQTLDSQQSTLQAEVSSGLALTQPSDNPAAVGQVLELQAQQSQLSQYGTNAGSALQTAQASYSGLNSLVQLMDSASEIAAQGSGAATTGSMTSYATQADQLVQQAVTVANSQFGSQYLYAGTAVDTAPFTVTTDPTTGQITGVTYAGNTQQAQVPLSSTSSIAPGTSGATNQGIATFINNLISIRDALQNGDTSALNTAASNLSSSEDLLTSAVADNGAVQGRIEADQTQIQSSVTETNQEISNLADANLPTTIVNLNQTQLAYQAAMQTAAKVMQLSLLNYISTT
jgi:flagellar hook-associated protein 3 FlgL